MNEVNSPAHYASGNIECIDAIQSMLSLDEFVGYLRGNIAKYTWRCTKKGNILQDVQKLRWYAAKLEEVIGA